MREERRGRRRRGQERQKGALPRVFVYYYDLFGSIYVFEDNASLGSVQGMLHALYDLLHAVDGKITQGLCYVYIYQQK